jgi:ferric-dicitrate binding protein FerR (iron transport regulator)
VDKTYNHIEDFLIDESFRSWVKDPTPELDKQWNEWLESNKEKEKLFNQAIMIANSLKFKEYKADSESKRRILKQIKAFEKPVSKTKAVLGFWYKVAAVLAIVISTISLLYVITYNFEDSPSFFTDNDTLLKQNIDGVKSEHLLSDGTKIYLNSGSSIEYPKAFSSGDRIVKLKEGEAFFEVAHDTLRPFIVQTAEYDVEVLGTEFNVNTNSQVSKVALVSGKVRLNFNANDLSMELAPGQMALYDKKRGAFSTTSFDVLKTTGWKEGYLVFQNASFDEVIKKLRSWYGIKISVRAAQPTDWSYTGSFKDESLEEVLLNMKTLRRFEYQIKDDSLIISN